MKTKNKQKGWGLIETLLTLGTISALSVGIYMAFAPTDATAKTKSEQENLKSFAESIGNSYGLLNNYSDLSNSKLISEKLVPNSMLQGNSLISAWGENVTVSPYRIVSDNDSFIVNYSNTPKEICNRLAAAGQNGAYDVLVNGSSVLEVSRKSVNIINASRLCQEGSALSFVFTGNGSSSHYAADPLDLPPPPAPVTPDWDTPITDVVPNPGGVGDATLPPVVTTPTVPAPTTPTPPLPTAPGPIAPTTPTTPVTPVPSTPPPTVGQCADGSESRVTSCPAGTWGSLNQSRVLSCNGEAWTPLSERVPSSWVTDSGVCTTCPSSSNETQTQWAPQNIACPAGSYGNYQIEHEQSRNRSVGYSCPAGTTSLPSPTYGGWSSWTNTGINRVSINTCSSCPAPSTETNYQWVNASAACPAGQTGSNTWQKQQVQSRSVSYSCPSGTSSIPAPNYGTWSGWSDTGATQAHSNTCAATKKCPVLVTHETGVLDTSDAYYSLSYTANGASDSCTTTTRDNGRNGSDDCDRKILDLVQWANVAVVGDTYYISGSKTGWEAGRGEFWGWDTFVYELQACP